MTLDEYQTKAAEFRIAGVPNEERVLGLLAEAGEVAGVFQRLCRGDFVPQRAEHALFAELGDVLWYLGQVAQDNGWELSEVAQANIEKLTSRKIRNLIQGTGDER